MVTRRPKIAAVMRILTAVVAVLCAPADGAESVPAFQGQVMGGLSVTSGNASSYLQNGWIIDAGFIYWLNHDDGLGIRSDASYSDHQANDQFRLFGNGSGAFSALEVGPLYRVPLESWVHPYAFAQVGVSHVYLRLVQSAFAPGSPCTSYPYCGYSSESSYTTNHLSWNVGVGADLATSWRESWYLEAQYRRIGASPRPYEYWPIMVGVRF